MATTGVGKIKGEAGYQLVIVRSYLTSKRLTITGPTMNGAVHEYTLTCVDSDAPNASRRVGARIAPDPKLPGVMFRFKVFNCDGGATGHPEGIVAHQPEDDLLPQSAPQ